MIKSEILTKIKSITNINLEYYTINYKDLLKIYKDIINGKKLIKIGYEYITKERRF